MKPEQAIKILEGQIEKYNSIDAKTCYTWKTQTSSYIKSFFGEHSDEYEFINKFMFDYDVYTIVKLPQENAKALTTFVRNCIETIKNVGLHKPPRPNFLFHIDNRWLITGICGAVVVIFTAGYVTGNIFTNAKNVEYKIKYENLRDSLDRLPVSPALNVPDKITTNDTSTDKNNKNSDSPHESKDSLNK